MTGWRIASDDGSSRSWHSSAALEDEYSATPPIKSGDRIRDLNDAGIIWSVMAVERRDDCAIVIRLV
jgi:hypothetical protein